MACAPRDVVNVTPWRIRGRVARALLRSTPMRLLVVDDEAGVREGMKRYLERCGYVIDCAARVAEARALLAAVRYDAVITDLQLSAEDGAEGFAVVVEARRACADTRIILLTGQTSDTV